MATLSGSFRDLGVAPQILEEQLSALRDAGYRLVGLTEALALRQSGDQSLIAALTFDDGYATFATAIPVLRSLGARATLYICPGFVGSLPKWLGRDAGVLGPLMNWSELEEISSRDIEIGNHSLEHIPLDILRTSELMNQLQRSRELIAENTGQYPGSFCYPHGYQSARVRQAVKTVGHKNACVIGHSVSDLADILRIERLMIKPNHRADQLITLLSVRRTWRSQTRAALYPAWCIARRAGYAGMGKVFT